MKVTWLAINASYSHSSMALPLLERCCCGGIQELEWSVVDTTINEQVSRTVEQVLNHQPDVVLGTAYLFTVNCLLETCSRIKRLMPETTIILGGPEFLGKNREFLAEHSFIDAVVRGEGEAIVVPLLKGRDQKASWKSIPGVCFQMEDGEIYDDGRSAPTLPAEEIPNPMESPYMDWSKKFVQLETSRGCPAHCSFCTSALNDGVRIMLMETIRANLQRVRDAGIREIRVLDRTFNHPPDRAKELLHCFLEEFPEMWFHLEIYPNLLTPEILEMIEHASFGQLHLEIGLQSTQTPILQSVRRPGFNHTARNALNHLCNMTHVPIHVDLLAGLPGQRMDDIYEDLRVLSEYCPEQIQLESLKILKGTPLAKEPDRFGIIHAEVPPYEVLQTDAIRFDELRQIMRVSRMLDAYYGARELHPIAREGWRNHPDFWRDFEAFLRNRVDVEVPQSLANRYRFLHQFLIEYDPSLSENLEVAWMKNGHSPSKGLVSAELWKGEIPEDSICLQMDGEHEFFRDSRTYHIRQKGRDYWVRIYRHSQQKVDIIGEWIRPFDR